LNIIKNKIEDLDIIFHLASNFSVQKSTEKPQFDLKNNFNSTVELLKSLRNTSGPINQLQASKSRDKKNGIGFARRA